MFSGSDVAVWKGGRIAAAAAVAARRVDAEIWIPLDHFFDLFF